MVLIQTGPGFGQLTVAASAAKGQCQARNYYGAGGGGKDERCNENATIRDPRGPCFCWVHHKAFNNPSRSYPLRLHKSATDGNSP